MIGLIQISNLQFQISNVFICAFMEGKGGRSPGKGLHAGGSVPLHIYRRLC
jgi:hypothetical protein